MSSTADAQRFRPGFWAIFWGGLLLGLGLPVVAHFTDDPFARYGPEVVAGVENPHDYQGQPLCQACHPNGDATLGADAIATCTRCHPVEHVNHPVGVVQVSPAPAEVGLPLGAGGEVLCHSCHDPHDLGRFPHGFHGPVANVCQICHPGY